MDDTVFFITSVTKTGVGGGGGGIESVWDAYFYFCNCYSNMPCMGLLFQTRNSHVTVFQF